MDQTGDGFFHTEIDYINWNWDETIISVVSVRISGDGW